MKTSAILSTFVLSAAFAAAQLSDIPQCALGCAISSIGSSGCSATDIPCVCKAQSFITAITACVTDACSAAELEKTIAAAKGLCLQAGVTLNIPSPAPSTTEAPPAPEPTTTEAPPAPEPTTTEAPPAPEPTTTEEAPAPPVYSSSAAGPVYPSTTAAPVKTTVLTTTICPTSAHTTVTYVPTLTTAYSNTTTYAPAPPAYTGAAGNVVANAGMAILGAAVAMIFA